MAFIATSSLAFDSGGGGFLRSALPAPDYSSVVFVLVWTKVFGSLKLGIIPDGETRMLVWFRCLDVA